MSKMSTSRTFSPEDWAIIKNVWTLAHPWKTKITQSFKAADPDNFLDVVNTDHMIRDYVGVAGKKFEVSYIDTSIDHIEELKKQGRARFLLICLRESPELSTGILLVRIPHSVVPQESYEFITLQPLT